MSQVHKYFIQYMLKYGVSTVEDALAFCNFVTKGEISQQANLKTLVSEINNRITKQSFRIVFEICEVTNNKVLVWINTKNDEISKLQTAFSAVELEYFHAILKEILNSDEHRITFIVCLNITSTLTASLSRSRGQNVLEKWIKIGYYVKKGDHIYLGPRLILEFNTYLKNYCPDSNCNLCSELVFTGKNCGNCRKTLHTICLSKYLERQNNCPYCHSEWNETVNENTILNTMTESDYIADMEVTSEEVPENIFEDYTQLTEQYSNMTQNSTQSSSNLSRRRTRRTTEQDLLEAGPSSRY